MGKKGLLGPLGAPQVVAIALGFILAQAMQGIASTLVGGILDSMLRKLNMSNGDGTFALNLGAVVSFLLVAAVAVAGVLLIARCCGGEEKIAP